MTDIFCKLLAIRFLPRFVCISKLQWYYFNLITAVGYYSLTQWLPRRQRISLTRSYIQFLFRVCLQSPSHHHHTIGYLTLFPFFFSRQGQVITFLDAHCECTEGWLEPLLARIVLDRKTVVCPIIDVISDETFEYVTASDQTWGGFNWKLNFRW